MSTKEHRETVHSRGKKPYKQQQKKEGKDKTGTKGYIKPSKDINSPKIECKKMSHFVHSNKIRNNPVSTEIKTTVKLR